MASIVIMVIRLHVILMFLRCADCQVLSTCLMPIYNQECDLNCTTADQSKVISFFKLPDTSNPVAECLGTFCQLSNTSFSAKYSIQSTDSTTTTFRINNLSWDEKGTWRCNYGSSPDIKDLGFAKYPDDIEYSGLSNNTEISSDTEMTITMKCLYTDISPFVTRIHVVYQRDGSTIRSNLVSCTDVTYSCADSNFFSKLCTAQLGSGVACGGNYSIGIAVSVLDNAEETYSAFTGIEIRCLKSATSSNEMTVEIGSSFLEVTGTIGISDIIPSFESTDFLFKPTTSINRNALSLEDSNSKNVISILPPSTSESLEPTELPNSENMKTEMVVSSSLFSLEMVNFTDETFISHSDISISFTTNLLISSASDLERNTEISLQDDSTQSQDLYLTTSGIDIDTQTHVTSFLNSVLMYTKTSNVQTDLSPSTLAVNHDSVNTLSLQPSSDNFIVSLYNQDSSADTFSLRIVTSPAGPVLLVETYSNNQLNTSVEPWSVSQTEFGLVNTSTFDAFTSYDNSASVFQIASSSGGTSEVQLLPISTTSFGQNFASAASFSLVEALSISLLSYFSSLSPGQSVHTSTRQMTVFGSSSVSQTVKSSNASVEQILSSHERSLINSFISFADTLTFGLNDLSATESITSIFTTSLNLSSYNQVVFSSNTLGDSQFPPFTDMSSSYQPELIVASSVNHFTHSEILSKRNTFSSQSWIAPNVSIVLSATSMQVLSLDTFKFRQTGQSMHLSTYTSIPFVDSATSEQPDSTPFVSSQIQFINTPLLTSVPVFLDTSSLGQLTPSIGLPYETSSVSVNFSTERMSTTIYDLSLLSPSTMLQVSSLTDIITFSEILSLNSDQQVTSVMNSIEPSDTVYVFSSPPTSTNTQAPELSFIEAQIIIVSCSIAVVILVVFVPLMVMYCLRKLSRSKKPEKDSLSSVNVPHVFNFDFVHDNPNMAKTLPVRYHSKVLLDLPYSRNFENNWNSLTS